jgi:anthranilate phosphoribosyltransferase
MLDEYLRRVSRDEKPSWKVVRKVAEHIMYGGVDPIMAGYFLAKLAEVGEEIPEIMGFQQAIKKGQRKIDFGISVGDLCGTGGFFRPRFNVSTGSAIVAAAMGSPVAKLCGGGSREANGSADFGEAIGCILALSDDVLLDAFSRFRLCLLDARIFLPALSTLRDARKQARCRTVVNLAAPLCHPVQLEYRLLGTTNSETAFTLAKILCTFHGLKRAWIVVGCDGIDELTVHGTSVIYIAEGGSVVKRYFSSRLLGTGICRDARCVGGNAQVNAKLFFQLLDKPRESPLTDSLALNAGAFRVVRGECPTLVEAFHETKIFILSGAVRDFFYSYRTFLQGASRRA